VRTLRIFHARFEYRIVADSQSRSPQAGSELKDEDLGGFKCKQRAEEERSFGARQGHPLWIRVQVRDRFGVYILDEALHFPLLLLKESALAYNLAAMAEWCAANNFLIAPHGKTTMTPRIFERQIVDSLQVHPA
jgi:hypothetical protein